MYSNSESEEIFAVGVPEIDKTPLAILTFNPEGRVCEGNDTPSTNQSSVTPVAPPAYSYRIKSI